MHNIDIHSRISQIVSIFCRLGMWRNEEESMFNKTKRQILYLSSTVSFIMSLVLGALLCEDINESIFLADLAVAIVVMAVKLSFILSRKKEIQEFLQDICVHSIADREQFTQVNMKLKNVMKLVTIFMSMGVMSICCLIILSSPVFSSEKSLPFNIWFPLDWKNSEIAYWAAYLFIVVGLWINMFSQSLTIIIWYLMLNSSIKYEILGNQFRNMGASSTSKTEVKKRKISEAEKQKQFHQELIDLIKTHQNIQQTIDRFGDCFANMFFAQITTSGICICSSVYMMVFSHANFFQYGFFVALLFYNICDIFMVMYFGNEIKLSSDQLSYCLFESDWTEQSKECKKCIIILTEVLKQPQELVIGILYPLNLETFSAILNLAYSMFNILQNFR